MHILLLLTLLSFSSMHASAYTPKHTNVRFAIVTQPALQAHMNNWMLMSLEVYREYPYLYDGTVESETDYFEFYARNAHAIMLVAKDDTTDTPVGYAVGIPLSDETPKKQHPFIATGRDPREYLLIVEFLVAPAFRHHGIARTMYTLFEEHIISQLPQYRYITAFGIERDNNPNWYTPQSHDPLYALERHCGWQRHGELTFLATWQDVGTAEPVTKKLVFWIKSLQP